MDNYLNMKGHLLIEIKKKVVHKGTKDVEMVKKSLYIVYIISI